MLLPWTPCLPIRGGKLKTTKNYSTSNPQLSFVCPSNSFLGNNAKNHGNTSTNSLNSSFIWREASPNNFNLYSTSVSSLQNATSSTSASPYRYSIGAHSRSPHEYRAVSEEKPSPSNKSKYKISSHYENVYVQPLLPQRKQIKIIKSSQENVSWRDAGKRLSSQERDAPKAGYILYDRRVNRSFEAPSRDMIIRPATPLRRSTPHLLADNGDDGDEIYQDASNSTTSNRHSATWCCGNFMLKQWKKINNCDC